MFVEELSAMQENTSQCQYRNHAGYKKQEGKKWKETQTGTGRGRADRYTAEAVQCVSARASVFSLA